MSNGTVCARSVSYALALIEQLADTVSVISWHLTSSRIWASLKTTNPRRYLVMLEEQQHIRFGTMGRKYREAIHDCN